MKRPHRLSSLLIFLIVLWLFGALVLIGLSVNVSWRLEERGVAINEVGSLRKQAFYLLSLSQTNDSQKQLQEYENFTQIIDKISLFSKHNFNDTSQYEHFLNQLSIIKEKSQEILPHFNPAIRQHGDVLPLTVVEDFVGEISQLVDIIEKDNTHSIVFLRWFQAMLLMMAISSAFLSSLFLRKLVISPLNLLNAGIQKVKKGNFKTQIDITVNNELGEISTGFNQMTAELHHMYQRLENVVDTKTEELEKRHRDLTFLYEISSLLQKNHDIDLIAQQFLEIVMRFTQAKGGIIRLLNTTKSNTEVIASSGFEADILNANQCNHLKDCFCGIALIKQRTIYHQNLTEDVNIDALCQQYQLTHLVSFKLSMTDDTLGSLNLFFEKEADYKAEDSHLLESVSRQFGLVLDNLRFVQLERQMAVLEERNFMAQGLHDSIAQSLSFLNIQSQLLTKAIEKNQLLVRDQALSFIKEGIQECYDDVRELLLNFRVNINAGNFADSILTVIDRFKRQTNIPLEYQFIDQGRELIPDVQLQIIFILQEALSNIRKHAQASLVQVKIEQYQKRFSLLIVDNGIGFDQAELNQKKKDGHIGTLIMEERARKADGQLIIHSIPNKGTTVSLEIQRTDITQKEQLDG